MAEIENGFFRWWPVLVVIVQGFFGWVLWSLRKQFVTTEDCSKSRASCGSTCQTLECDCQSLNVRMATVEEGIKRLPTAESWSSMQVAIEGLRGANKELQAKIEGQTAVLQRIERPLELLIEHHLKEGK